MISEYTLFQRIAIGRVSLEIGIKELASLRLLFAERDALMGLWSVLWEDIRDYDQLPAGCRQILPAIVQRVQVLDLPEVWERENGLRLHFLRGLPRFVWTKNRIILHILANVAAACEAEDIQIVAIKGCSELLVNSKKAAIRPTSDVDILIKERDLKAFARAVESLGYCQVCVKNHTGLIRPSAPQISLEFRSKVNAFCDIDVHLRVDYLEQQGQLTQGIWANRFPSGLSPALSVPGPEERYLISLLNAFRLGNWSNHSYLKYISDVIEMELDMGCAFQVKGLGLACSDFLSPEWGQQITSLGRALGRLPDQSPGACVQAASRSSVFRIDVNGELISTAQGYISLYLRELRYFLGGGLSWSGIGRITVSPLIVLVIWPVKSLLKLTFNRFGLRKRKVKLKSQGRLSSKMLQWSPWFYF